LKLYLIDTLEPLGQSYKWQTDGHTDRLSILMWNVLFSENRSERIGNM